MPTDQDQENVNTLATYLSRDMLPVDALDAVEELYDKAPGNNSQEKTANFHDIIVKGLANSDKETLTGIFAASNLHGKANGLREFIYKTSPNATKQSTAMEYLENLLQDNSILPRKITAELQARETTMKTTFEKYIKAVDENLKSEKDPAKREVLTAKKTAAENIVKMVSNPSQGGYHDLIKRKETLNKEYKKIVSPRGFKDKAIILLKQVAHFFTGTYKSSTTQARLEKEHEQTLKLKK